jgi:hypothetical protein
MCTVLLPPGVNSTAVSKTYEISNNLAHNILSYLYAHKLLHA